MLLFSPFKDTISFKICIDKGIYEDLRDDFYDFLFLILVSVIYFKCVHNVVAIKYPKMYLKLLPLSIYKITDRWSVNYPNNLSGLLDRKSHFA